MTGEVVNTLQLGNHFCIIIPLKEVLNCKFGQQMIVKRWRFTSKESEKIKNKVLHPYIKQFFGNDIQFG